MDSDPLPERFETQPQLAHRVDLRIGRHHTLVGQCFRVRVSGTVYPCIMADEGRNEAIVVVQIGGGMQMAQHWVGVKVELEPIGLDKLDVSTLGRTH